MAVALEQETRIASPRIIGQWVAALGAEELTQRETIIQQVEASGVNHISASIRPVAPSAPDSVADAARSSPNVVLPRVSWKLGSLVALALFGLVALWASWPTSTSPDASQARDVVRVPAPAPRQAGSTRPPRPTPVAPAVASPREIDIDAWDASSVQSKAEGTAQVADNPAAAATPAPVSAPAVKQFKGVASRSVPRAPAPKKEYLPSEL
jgi:hypothetical protein